MSFTLINEVDGCQGIVYADGYFYVSDTSSLLKYDSEWNLIIKNNK